MKTFTNIIIILMIIISTNNPLYAQNKTKGLGFGVSLGKEFLGGTELNISLLDFPSFYVPIILSSTFKLEPEIGFYSYSMSIEDPNEGWEKVEYYNIFSLGLGIFPLKQYDKVIIHYGVRLGLIHYSLKDCLDDKKVEKSSKTDYIISPSTGGEYFFNEHFSLGGETQLNIVFVDQYDDYYYDIDVSETIIKSKVLFFLRWYF